MVAKSVPFWFMLVVDFAIGSNYGLTLTNLPLEVLKLYTNNNLDDDLSSVELSLSTVAVLIGSLIGSASVTYYADRYGRKMVTIVSAAACCVFNLLCIVKTAWVYVMVMRFLVGIPSAALTTTIPMWLSEMAETNKRGYLTICF